MSSLKSKKKEVETSRHQLIIEVDPSECPFREFKDNELTPDLWGLGPAALRATLLQGKMVTKAPVDFVWVDDQTQPLPRSVRQYLNGWTRAEDLAAARWGAEVVIFEESDGSGKMSVQDTQLSHAQVLVRSSFCRRVLSACFMLERVDGLTVEHQWENFLFTFTEGWRARYHIYSPGMKPGGGQQHRPIVSKNGCYLVRLYYLGAWRCVWVNDQVPVDATDSPLLPFSPLLHTQPPKPGGKSQPAMVFSNVVHLWPMLICKALLKLSAPDMSSDEESDFVEDELIPEFNIMHALTGCMDRTFTGLDPDALWNLISTEIPVFSWDDDDETMTSTVKSKTKKPNAKENKETRTRNSLATITIQDTKDEPPYLLPGITPGHEMTLLVNMARDLPLKKPLPEPEVALWKYHRWVEWARRHGLYAAYDCPRDKFLKVTGLMKLSYAPHLLDVMSTESSSSDNKKCDSPKNRPIKVLSEAGKKEVQQNYTRFIFPNNITYGFREEHEKTAPPPAKKGAKGDMNQAQTNAKGTGSMNQLNFLKDELREWIQFTPLSSLILQLNVIYFPSMFDYTTATSSPLMRITKAPANRALDIPASKTAPLYLQIDGPETNTLRLALAMLHPRVLVNSGIPLEEHLEPAYLILEKFEWFKDCDLPMAKAFIQTRGYDSVEVKFLPGRHFCRLWVHSRLNWHVMLLSDSTLLLGSRDIVQAAAVLECPWAARFLNSLSNSFLLWAKNNRSSMNVLASDREFFKSYGPDLTWDPEIVGEKQHQLHWMFRQALQSLLKKRLASYDFHAVCRVFRHFFCDPEFGLPLKPIPPKSLRDIVALDPCDCLMPEMEEPEQYEEYIEEEEQSTEQKPLVHPDLMAKLLTAPVAPAVSQICEYATEELPCGILKDEREKMIKKHEAATFLQANWRGTWARKCMNVKVTFTSDVMKLVMDNAFGNLDALSALMNEFFGMFPGTKTAYSVASALAGVNGLTQHQGTASATAKCKWIPFFQGVFFCHAPVKVHFTVQSTLQYSTVLVYDNDSGLQLPSAYNAHVTFDISPNIHGYTVMGHGTLLEAKGHNFEVHWQLTILSSRDGAFHVCDNDREGCKEQSMPSSYKLHIEDIFIPNRRNILGGLLISVTKEEAFSFRAAASSPELEITATLRTISPSGEPGEDIASCSGKGEIFWPYIRVQPHPPDMSTTGPKHTSKFNVQEPVPAPPSSAKSGGKSAQPKKNLASLKGKSMTKIRTILEPKQYSIEVTAPTGWPLTLAQWRRVDEVRNYEATEKRQRRDSQQQGKKGGKSAGKSKDLDRQSMTLASIFTPLPDDAYIELECGLAVSGGAVGKRDDLRDIELATARRLWEVKEPGRNLRGAAIRNVFREEFLVAPPPPPSESVATLAEVVSVEEAMPQGPTPATESGMLEIELEIEEEARYLLMPEQLREKFIPLHFVQFCTRERNDDEIVLLTLEMAEAAKQARHARIEAAIERMKELQAYNEEHVLLRQRRRCMLLEQLAVDSSWCQDLMEILEERDDAIARETLARQLSANRKKQEQKDQLKGKDQSKQPGQKKK